MRSRFAKEHAKVFTMAGMDFSIVKAITGAGPGAMSIC